jgi:plasmid maintenance system antidote protein VapI
MKSKRIKLAPLHPGEILREDLWHRQRKARHHALMALRLARYFGTSPELWLGLQQDYELDVARDTAAAKIEIQVLPRAS